METMNILIAINDNFAKYAVVLLNSLYLNHKDMQIDTYILYVSLSKDNIKLIDDFAKTKQQKAIFIDANGYIDQINEMSKNISARLGKETYLRLFAPDLLPVNINRYLYLDTDIVVNKNISEFYYQDFLEACIVSPSQSLDYIRVQSLKRNLSAAMKSEYFNAGVILFNVQKIRGRITAQTYVEALQKFENGHANDQQLLNAVFYDKMKFANPVIYNFRYSMICQDKQRTEIFKLYGIEEKNLLNVPAIIHFTSWVAFGKPWDLYFEEDELKGHERGMIPGLPAHEAYVINEEQNKLAGIWWKYAKDTPVYKELYKALTIKKDWYLRQVEAIVSRYYQKAALNAKQKNMYDQDFIFINHNGRDESICQGRVTESYEGLLIKRSNSNFNFYRYNLEKNRRYLMKVSGIKANFDEYTAGVYDFKNDRIIKYEIRSTKAESVFEFILGEHVENLAFCIYAGVHRYTAGKELEVGEFTIVWEPLVKN